MLQKFLAIFFIFSLLGIAGAQSVPQDENGYTPDFKGFEFRWRSIENTAEVTAYYDTVTVTENVTDTVYVFCQWEEIPQDHIWLTFDAAKDIEVPVDNVPALWADGIATIGVSVELTEGAWQVRVRTLVRDDLVGTVYDADKSTFANRLDFLINVPPPLKKVAKLYFIISLQQ